MKSIISSFKFSELSLFRDSLMGVGILGVLTAHALAWMKVDAGFIYKMLNLFSRLVFVEGFLFLSGLGIYYSLAKNKGRFGFLKKRVCRVLFPFILITLPFYFLSDILLINSVWKFFLDITTLSFWFYGNNGMWYISISMVLYLVSPLIFNILNSKYNECFLCTFIVLHVIFCELLYLSFYKYYELVNIGILKTPMFVLGMYWGYYSWFDRAFKPKHGLILIGIFMIFILIKRITILCQSEIFIAYYESFFRLFCMILLCFGGNMLQENVRRKIKVMLEWFGRYTLELYILHMSFYIMFELFFSDIEGILKSIIVGFIIFMSIMLCVPVKKFTSSLSNRLVN